MRLQGKIVVITAGSIPDELRTQIRR